MHPLTVTQGLSYAAMWQLPYWGPGEIGIRTRLKISRPQGLTGSSPVTPTTFDALKGAEHPQLFGVGVQTPAWRGLKGFGYRAPHLPNAFSTCRNGLGTFVDIPV